MTTAPEGIQPRVRVAVKMQPSVDAEGRAIFKATLPLGVLFEKSLDPARLEDARRALETSYRALITELQRIRAAMKARGALRYWEFGDAIARFEDEHASRVLFVEPLTAHLVRDVPFSETMVLLCRRFREKIPSAAALDPRLSFNRYYRAGFDPTRLAKTARRGRARRKK